MEAENFDATDVDSEDCQDQESPNAGLDFGEAVKVYKNGRKVARAGWNGKGMYLFYITSWFFTGGPSTAGAACLPRLNFVAMRTATGEVVPWLASQTDIDAEDWEIIE